ncbi:MAG: heme NO-binding domain-containing protein [Granulosicoccus sp.]|nr:heme NO-binding domain-containing protein [Granulosicoccus sp.]
MKGIVFNLLADMVEEKFSLEVWDNLLQATGQDGVYVSTESYPDDKLFALVTEASNVSGIPANDLVRTFGEYMFPRFFAENQSFFSPGMTLKEFLLMVDRVIHVEVRKLHPDANLPQFEYIDETDNELTMMYSSPRKLCMLAEGLIAGAADHFETQYTLEHDECMHDGAEACKLHLKVA